MHVAQTVQIQIKFIIKIAKIFYFLLFPSTKSTPSHAPPTMTPSFTSSLRHDNLIYLPPDLFQPFYTCLCTVLYFLTNLFPNLARVPPSFLYPTNQHPSFTHVRRFHHHLLSRRNNFKTTSLAHSPHPTSAVLPNVPHPTASHHPTTIRE